MQIERQLASFVVNHQYTKAYERALPYVNQIAGVEYKKKKQKFMAEIQGTELYQTSLEFTEQEVVSDCSCPVQNGTCKHVVALSLYVQRNLDKIAPQKQPVLKEMKNLSRKQLLSILKTVVKGDKQLAEQVAYMVEQKLAEEKAPVCA